MPYVLRLLECLIEAKARVYLLYFTSHVVVARQEMNLTLPKYPFPPFTSRTC
jgi:hypothetical protein